MQCARCKKEIEKHMQKESLCENCFIEIIEHKARKALAKKGLKKGDKILIIDDGSKEFAASEQLIRKIMQDVPLSIDVKKKETTELQKAEKKYTAIILPRDLDDEAETLITAAINNKQVNKDKTINVLENIYDREVKTYADIKKFRYAEQEKSEIKKALEKIETTHPLAGYATIKTLNALRNSEQ